MYIYIYILTKKHKILMFDFRFLLDYPFTINFIMKVIELSDAYGILVICYFTGITIKIIPKDKVVFNYILFWD